MLSARGASQLASKVGQLLKKNAANRAKLTEGGKGEDEINWLLAKDKVHVFHDWCLGQSKDECTSQPS